MSTRKGPLSFQPNLWDWKAADAIQAYPYHSADRFAKINKNWRLVDVKMNIIFFSCSWKKVFFFLKPGNGLTEIVKNKKFGVFVIVCTKVVQYQKGMLETGLDKHSSEYRKSLSGSWSNEEVNLPALTGYQTLHFGSWVSAR